jgi:hypothetical protein
MRMSDEEARKDFATIHWADNDGEPYYPARGASSSTPTPPRSIFQCKGCDKQISYTSGTLFASRKLSLRDYLAPIALFGP